MENIGTTKLPKVKENGSQRYNKSFEVGIQEHKHDKD